MRYAFLFITCTVFSAASDVLYDFNSARDGTVPTFSCVPMMTQRSDLLDSSLSPRDRVCRQMPIGMQSDEFTLYTFSNQAFKEETRRGRSGVVQTTKAQHLLIQGGSLEERLSILNALKRGLSDIKTQRAIISKGEKNYIEVEDIINPLKDVLPLLNRSSDQKEKKGPVRWPSISVLEICVELLRKDIALPKSAHVRLEKKGASPCDVTFTPYNCEVIDFKNGYLMVPISSYNQTMRKHGFSHLDDVEIVKGKEPEALKTFLDKVPNLKAMLFIDEE